MSPRYKKILLCSCIFVLSACSVIRSDITELGPTLADLGPAALPPDPPKIEKVSIDEIERSYYSALQVAVDPALRKKIKVRLADIEMSRSEKRQLVSADDNKYFDKAISFYDELLSEQTQEKTDETEERLLYRLAKAYALDGRMLESNVALEKLAQKYPQSNYRAESEFRQAEISFSERKYDDAEKHFGAVVEFGEDSPFYLNSLYMRGWAQFKRSRYDQSIVSFTQVLDTLLGDSKQLNDLDKSPQNLANDTLRVMGFAFSYLDGAASITRSYQALGERHYLNLIYQKLASLFLEKKRYRDAADTLESFIRDYPDSEYGPAFIVQMVEVYNRGNFPSMILPAKENFISLYGVRSEFWAQKNTEQRSVYSDTLKMYLDEVSSYYHSRAQLAKKESKTQTKKNKKTQNTIQADLVKASDYYSQYIEAFPEDKQVASFTFLMAEALNEVGKLPDALLAYESVAYQYPESPKAAESAYAAIIVPQALMKRFDRAKNDKPNNGQAETDFNFWQQKEIDNSIRFADNFASDPRAVSVLNHVAETQFKRGNLSEAIALASRITQWQPQPDGGVLRTAWLVLGHSEFDSKRFDLAEGAYRTALKYMTLQDQDRPAVVDRIAASMFKSAELKVAAGNKLEAAEQLLSIKTVAPNSSIAVNAEFDAGTYFMELENWTRAEAIFVGFQKKYPVHSLTKTILPKLVVLYQSMENWPKAASSLESLAKSAKTPEERRKAQYLAAELYVKSKQYTRAITAFTQYVRKYPKPFDLAVEARSELVKLTLISNQKKTRDYWLKQLIRTHGKAGKNRTDRSRYLAAMAASEFAERDFVKFQKLKLTLPFKRSIKAKLKALNQAVSAYKGVLNYKVADFSTLANHQLGSLSSILYSDLMNSERPKKISEAGLEEYELMLEEQAYPHKKKAVALLEANTERSWVGIYDKWVKKSFKDLAKLLPARYGKKEKQVEVSRGFH